MGWNRISGPKVNFFIPFSGKAPTMKPIQLIAFVIRILVLIFPATLIPARVAGQSCDTWIAKAVSVQGFVQVKKTGENYWTQVKLNDTYCSGDIIRVSENSRAALVLGNETFLRLDQNSTLTITSQKEKNHYVINLFKGVIHFFTCFPKRVTILTHFVNATVEGTEFYVNAEPAQTFLSIFEGRVAAENEAGRLVLAEGQTAVFKDRQAPDTLMVIRPRDAVQWALYYPPIINWKPSDFHRGQKQSWESMVRKSIGYYWNGEIAPAFSAISDPPQNIKDPRFYTYRAALSLTVGRVDTARTDIAAALMLDPSNAYALALKSVISTVQNQKDQAIALAKLATDSDPASAPAWVALSYAQQARFDLQGALNSLKQGAKSDPENALIWANIAEIQLALGNLSQSAEAAARAIELNPNLSKTQTIFGFSHLIHIRINDAKAAFEKAIELDSAAPLPRLGLGLAKIRGGDLEDGRKEIEIAAGIDPDNALVRSYLGKAYHEEKHDPSAQKQLEVAKKLDPLDPTPWFYDAIRKQSVNRPVEALHDLEKSIELNHNRAVYRSRLLLDQDLAARNAGLGNIYDNLGFQMQGLAQGWKSVNIDPTNHSAHRLLADLYPAVPRHNIARVSELLQAQLLQPLNTTPLQPLLAENNTLILENAGPTDLSTNEFSPLFLRNQLTLQLDGIVGSKNTWGNEIIQSGLWNRFSYSLGQFHYESDGFRPNNDQKQDIINGFFQGAISPKTSIQAEIRHKDREFGDLELLFNPAWFNPNLRQHIQTNTYRLGLRHSFSPGSDMIVSLMGSNIDESINNHDEFVTTEIDENTKGYLGETLHYYRREKLSLITGIGYYNAELKKSLKFISANPEIFPDFISRQKPDKHHFNGYIYPFIHWSKDLTFTTGFSYDSFDDDRTSRDQLNPKLGATWNPISPTTFRLALFRNLRRTLISEQTIEPTQIAGFNQLFEDVPGTDVWTWGVAMEQKLPRNLFGGIQFFRRHLDVPYEDINPIPGKNEFERTDWDESIGNIYFYWAPHTLFTFKAEYWYEEFDRGKDFSGIEEIIDLKTNRLNLEGNFFHPCGLFAGLKTSYIHQKGEFGDPQSPPTTKDDDNFWVIDANVGYRLPNRRGHITLEIKNLFDDKFQYQDIDPTNPRIVSERQIFTRIRWVF